MKSYSNTFYLHNRRMAVATLISATPFNSLNVGSGVRPNSCLGRGPTSRLRRKKRRRRSSATLWRSLSAHYITAAVILQMTAGGVSSTLVRTWNPRLRKKVPSTTRREEDEERKRRSFRPQELIFSNLKSIYGKLPLVAERTKQFRKNNNHSS